jgi:hypothetical protein
MGHPIGNVLGAMDGEESKSLSSQEVSVTPTNRVGFMDLTRGNALNVTGVEESKSFSVDRRRLYHRAVTEVTEQFS